MSKCKCQIHKGYKSLKPKMVVKVFLEQDDGTFKYECKAILIELMRTWYAEEPFPIVDSCSICGKTTNNIKQKWLVEVIPEDPFTKPIRIARNIHKFHSYGTPHIRDELDSIY